MPNEIDELMALDPLELSSQDIDAIIAYHRKARAAHASGVKVKKTTSNPIDLEKIGLVVEEAPIKRRKLT